MIKVLFLGAIFGMIPMDGHNGNGMEITGTLSSAGTILLGRIAIGSTICIHGDLTRVVALLVVRLKTQRASVLQL